MNFYLPYPEAKPITTSVKMDGYTNNEYDSKHATLDVLTNEMVTPKSSPRFFRTASIRQREKLELEQHILYVNIAYISSIGVSGVVLCTLGSDLAKISQRIGIDPTIFGGTAFLLRGVGSMSGALLSSHLYRLFDGDAVIITFLVFTSILISLATYCNSSEQLLAYFFLLGICSSINDTGCIILTRKLRGRKAGPWLGLNGVAFGLAASLVPLLQQLSSNFTTQHSMIAVLILAVATYTTYVTQQQVNNLDDFDRFELVRQATTHDDLVEEHKEIDEIAPHFWCERAVSFMLFWLVGGQVDVQAYLAPYIKLTGVVSSSNAGNVIVVFWLFVTAGRLVGVLHQRVATEESLLQLLVCCLGLGSFALLLIMLFPNSPIVLIMSVALYALSYGPTVAFCQDLNNRLTLPTERSTSIVQFGVNSGAAFVPYFTSYAWKHLTMLAGNPITLIVVVFCSVCIPLPVLYMLRSLSYKDDLSNFHIHRAKTFYDYDNISVGWVDQAKSWVATEFTALLSGRRTSWPVTNYSEKGPVEVQLSLESLFKKERLIESGKFGKVFLSLDTRNQSYCAMKEISKSQIHRSRFEHIHREVAILRELDHPHIVKLLDFFEDPFKFYVVLELLEGGELFEKLVQKSLYTEKEARDLVVSMLQALKHCHDRGVVHRDLKPENLMLAHANDVTVIKIIDFGIAKHAQGFNLLTRCGSVGYMAPEIINRVNYGAPVDMWSAGVLVYTILAGYTPFHDRCESEECRKSSLGVYSFHPEYWSSISSEAKALICGLLTVDMHKRLTADQALKHKWLKIPDVKLSQNNLEMSLDSLKSFNARRKWCVAISAVMAMQRISHGPNSATNSMKISHDDSSREFSCTHPTDATSLI